MCRELPQVEEENILEEIVIADGYRRLHRDQRPPDRGVYPGGRPPDRGGYPNRGGRPPDQVDTLVEDPLIEAEGPWRRIS